MKTASFALLSVAAVLANGQASVFPIAEVESSTWNSSFKFTKEQIDLGRLTPELVTSLETILNFDRSQLANGGPSQDSFYKLPSNYSAKSPRNPGQVLKIQEFTDPNVYNIPAQTALSRILYSTTDFNGTLILASAAILWPFTPKKFSAGKGDKNIAKAPVVLWTHGTSGFYADGAPSAHRSLFYGDIIPFTLAQAGYVVVAPDYSGLGIDKSWDGSFIPHQYLIRNAAAGDALNAIRAVRNIKTFSDKITDQYVVMGHSQGGAVAWAVSELLAQKPQKYSDCQAGHLGTIVFNPFSGSLSEMGPEIFFPWVGKALDSIFPSFKLSYWLTDLGVARTQLLDQLQGGQFVSQVLFENATEIVNPAWNQTWYEEAVTPLTNPGKVPFKGPMILIEGTGDRGDSYNRNKAIWNATCRKYGGDFEFAGINGTGHFPTMDATRQMWLRWIEDRFEGKPVNVKGCATSELTSFLPAARYQSVTKSYFEWTGKPEWFYGVPAGSF
ncbi:alpha/beta-hydrolase [Coniochaeta sp. PMI_546]|nr:alpha/beta-hydrolase [Coniochaeta sp. PMI_546]